MSTPFRQEHPLLDKLVTIEAFLVQLVIYLFLWFWNDYLALILSIILGGIAVSILVISKMVELVESSRVPKVYYRFMVICILAPLLAGIAGILLSNGVSWLE
jgi:H+/Cl- antiporter ClcA